MQRIAKAPKASQRPKSSNYGKNIVIGSILALVAFGLMSGCNMVSNLRLLRALNVQLMSMSDYFEIVEQENLLMVTQYVKREDRLDFKLARFSRTDKEMARALKDVDKDRLVILTKMISETNYQKDWTAGVENLHKGQPAFRNFGDYRPDVSYHNANACSSIMHVLARLSAKSEDSRETTRLFLANLSLPRQYISYARGNKGLELVDVDILLSYAGQMSDILQHTNNLNSFAGKHFPEVKNRFEDFDKLFPLTKPAAELEGTNVESFFRYYNDKVGWSLSKPRASLDQKWLDKVLAYYLPKSELFTKPFNDVKQKLEKKKSRRQRLKEVMKTKLHSMGKYAPEKAFARYLITEIARDYSRIYQKECMTRAQLRAIYLAYALAYLRDEMGTKPAGLCDLEKYVSKEMMINPISGEQFRFSTAPTGKMRIAGHNGDEEVTFLEF